MILPGGQKKIPKNSMKIKKTPFMLHEILNVKLSINVNNAMP